MLGRALAFTSILLARPAAGLAGEVLFSDHLIRSGYGYADGIAVADLDGDGDPDLTSADAVGRALHWFENDGFGNWSPHFVQQNHPDPRLERHAVGDLNGDGHLDIAIVENLHGDLLWFENDGTPADGLLWTQHAITVGGMPWAYDVTLADLDGDGDADLIASGAEKNQTVWYENRLDLGRRWRRRTIDRRTIRPLHPHVADLDGDGDLDVLLAFGSGTATYLGGAIAWYENAVADGRKARWTKHTIAEVFETGTEAVAADLDGDGDLDVAATAWGDQGRVVWFENGGDPTGPWLQRPIRENWPRANQLVAADLDGDGRVDVAAVAENGSNEARWWRNEGAQ